MALFSELIKKLFESGNAYLLFLVLIVPFWKAQVIFQFLTHVRNHRKETLIANLKIAGLSEATRNAHVDEIERIVYFQATRMVRSRLQREVIKQLCDRSKGEIEIGDFRKASRNLVFKDRAFVPDTGRLAKALVGFSWVMFAALLLIGTMLITTAVFDKWSLLETSMLSAAGVLYTFIAGFMLSQSFPYFAARNLGSILKRLPKDDATPNHALTLPELPTDPKANGHTVQGRSARTAARKPKITVPRNGDDRSGEPPMQ